MSRIYAGFTFSFPMIQHSLDAGILVTWTKTFNCPDSVNKDIVKLLREALDRRGDTKVKVVAVLNDTTGTLVQGSTLDHNVAIGLILGTGSNACYLERADRVEHWETERHGEREVSIDVALNICHDFLRSFLFDKYIFKKQYTARFILKFKIMSTFIVSFLLSIKFLYTYIIICLVYKLSV